MDGIPRKKVSFQLHFFPHLETVRKSYYTLIINTNSSHVRAFVQKNLYPRAYYLYDYRPSSRTVCITKSDYRFEFQEQILINHKKIKHFIIMSLNG